jgi:hypothetical protein
MTDSEPPRLSQDLLRRIAFVRYLADLGVRQSKQPEPLSSVAVLMLHDAVEMFLQIVAEHRGVDLTKNIDFIGYWTAFEKAGVPLTHKVAMGRLNAARVNVKHRGVAPAHREIEGFSSTVPNFLLENAKSTLGIDFDRVSLTDLLQLETVRSALQASEAALGSGDLETAMAECAKAFVHAMNEYIRRPRANGIHRPGTVFMTRFRTPSLGPGTPTKT